jgi:ABC-type uncharacterized transport system fused permease/ATPase subunit
LSCTNARLHAGFAQGEAFGGEQQRLAFARVLIHPPDILIMDEPTLSLDGLSQFRLMEYMRDLLPDTMVIGTIRSPREFLHEQVRKLGFIEQFCTVFNLAWA